MVWAAGEGSPGPAATLADWASRAHNRHTQ